MSYIFHFLFLFEIQSFKIDNMFLLISVLITFFFPFILNIKYSSSMFQNISWDSHVSQPVFWLLGAFMTVKFPYFCGGKLNFYFYLSVGFFTLYFKTAAVLSLLLHKSDLDSLFPVLVPLLISFYVFTNISIWSWVKINLVPKATCHFNPDLPSTGLWAGK